MSIETEAIKKQKAKQAETAPQPAIGTETPQASLIGDLGNSDVTVQAHAAQLGNEQFPTAQRQITARQIGDVGGNHYMQRVMTEIQRTPQSSTTSQTASPKKTTNLHDDFRDALKKWASNRATATYSTLIPIVNSFAKKLWEEGRNKVQSAVAASSGPTDIREDKWLSDTREQMLVTLETETAAIFPPTSSESKNAESAFERGSRGVMDENGGFTSGKDTRKVLISGFDPFPDPNSSGAAALALDGKVVQVAIGSKMVDIEIQSIVFPVRWRDFDNQIIDSFMGPYVDKNSNISMILGIGEGDTRYEIEHEASNSRLNIPDNEGERGHTRRIGLDKFKETTLPPEVKERLKNDLNVSENREHDKEKGDTRDYDGNPREDFGTPGGYLCNELMYRSLDYIEKAGKPIPVGFLHVPSSGVRTTEVIAMVEKIIKTSVAAMP